MENHPSTKAEFLEFTSEVSKVTIVLQGIYRNKNFKNNNIKGNVTRRNILTRLVEFKNSISGV